MLYLAVVSFLLSVALGAIQFVHIGDTWADSEICDNSEWEFSNPDPAVRDIHRDFGDELVLTCHRGEWGGSSPEGVDYGFTPVTLLSDSDIAYTDPVMMHVGARIWAFCDFQSADRVELDIYDMYNGDLTNDAMKLEWETRYDRVRTVWSKGKRDDSCFDSNTLYNWDFGATTTFPDWLNEIECTQGSNGVSCYADLTLTEEIKGGVIGLMFKTTMDDTIDNAAWAFSNIKLTFPEVENCCTGNHQNSKKSCESLHEKRNCENKGCDWNSASDVCNLDCCRYIDPSDKNNKKPKCKNINYLFPDRTQCIGRKDCKVSQCDRIGQMDGILNP